MDYFANQNRVKLVSMPEEENAGKFVFSDGKFVNSSFDLFEATVKDMRPAAVNFDGDKTFYNDATPEYQAIVNGCYLTGCWGWEVALDIGGDIYILFLCSKTLRALMPDLMKAMDRRVMFKPIEFKTGRYTWFGIQLWCPTSTISGYMEEYSHDDEYDYI